MIFSFLKYIKPVWYYNLVSKKDFCYFPYKEDVIESGFYLQEDEKYVSEESRKRDLAWRAFQMGFISKRRKSGLDIWKEVILPVEDEYRFVRKNFHSAWAFYILLLRLLFMFHNPFREIWAFGVTRKIKRETYVKSHFYCPAYETFESDLIKSNPLVSVIIPTLNRYEYLKAVLHDLEKQHYKNFEVIVVDQADEFKEEFYSGWEVKLKFWHQKEKALWKARNEAIRMAKGKYILMSEDDIRIPENFIYDHLKALDFFAADASCGVFYPEGKAIPQERSYFKYAEQFATGNSLLKREIFEEIGLFDRQFERQRMGDGEFGLRMYINGFKLISNPRAYCVDVKAPVGGLRIAGGSWDAWRPRSIFAPRPVPSVLYLSRKYFGDKRTILMIIPSLLPSIVPYRFKNNKLLKMCSFLFLPFLFPLLMYQACISWNEANGKLKKGSMIDLLQKSDTRF